MPFIIILFSPVGYKIVKAGTGGNIEIQVNRRKQIFPPSMHPMLFFIHSSNERLLEMDY